MGIGWIYFEHLEKYGVYGNGRKKLLDIGAQNIFDIPVESGISFLRKCGSRLDDISLRSKVEDISRRSVWPPKKAGVFLHEFLDGTDLEYTGFDIFPGHRVEIFDMNYQSLTPNHIEAYDLIFNFGTTEHVFNQYNCFKVVHEAAKPGAYIFHQLPCTGWMDHGYWVYSPRLFMDLAEANDYEICELWCSGPLGTYNLYDRLTYVPNAKDRTLPQNAVESWEQTPIANGLINVLFRKRNSGPFRLGLDITTTAGGPDSSVMQTYFTPQVNADSNNRNISLLRLFTAKEIAAEFVYRVRRKLGLAK